MQIDTTTTLLLYITKSEIAKLLLGISDTVQKKASNTANSENEEKGDSKLLENKDTGNTEYHDLLPKNTPDVIPKKPDRECDKHYEQSSDKTNIASPNGDKTADLNKTEHRPGILTKPNHQSDSDNPITPKGGNDPQKNGKKVIFNEDANHIDGKLIKSKRKYHRKGRKNRTATDLNESDIEKAKLATIEEKTEETISYNHPPYDQPLDLSKKKV
ncbi:conserved Plasmodium protein, unknown function [Plasmodium vinckei vinckei]|uniref:Uncharacterized protein n=1 Tax=Plasmodium vinckei vinckei TaxID=54757 RepID=A0A449BPE1_PLAVN|nr:conserved Plasmodium protein, unknown function [Plasmodium vinckei vinckei]VEV55314.1 conserved Plasmodium protein, unknown function [Plasmodium vinckei vinckei]